MHIFVSLPCSQSCTRLQQEDSNAVNECNILLRRDGKRRHRRDQPLEQSLICLSSYLDSMVLGLSMRRSFFDVHVTQTGLQFVSKDLQEVRLAMIGIKNSSFAKAVVERTARHDVVHGLGNKPAEHETVRNGEGILDREACRRKYLVSWGTEDTKQKPVIF